MMTQDPYCHTTSIAVNRPAEEAFRYMADGIKQGEWAFGSWDREQIGAGLFKGTSTKPAIRSSNRMVASHQG